MISNLDKLVTSGRRVVIEHLLRPVDEEEFFKKITDEDLCHITERGAIGFTVGTQKDG